MKLGRSLDRALDKIHPSEPGRPELTIWAHMTEAVYDRVDDPDGLGLFEVNDETDYLLENWLFDWVERTTEE